MGYMKELMIERMEEEAEERLAHKLGLTYDDLMELDHTIDTEVSNDGLLYNYIISFGPDAPNETLAKVKGINKNNNVWFAPWELDEDDYYEEQFEAIISNKNYFDSFLQAISSAKKLNELYVDDAQLTTTLKRQIYVSVMAALEAFLSETFINLTNEDDTYFRNFIESFPDFKERKFELSRIFVEQEKLKETAKKVMIEVIYHNIWKVEKMYSSTFKITFPEIAKISKYVSVRHDLVHRNGKTTKGDSVVVDTETINQLISDVSSFVEEIAKELRLTIAEDEV